MPVFKQVAGDRFAWFFCQQNHSMRKALVEVEHIQYSQPKTAHGYPCGRIFIRLRIFHVCSGL